MYNRFTYHGKAVQKSFWIYYNNWNIHVCFSQKNWQKIETVWIWSTVLSIYRTCFLNGHLYYLMILTTLKVHEHLQECNEKKEETLFPTTDILHEKFMKLPGIPKWGRTTSYKVLLALGFKYAPQFIQLPISRQSFSQTTFGSTIW